ncbi:hypothetical protein GKE82_25165 [Conexibacter sp. W3-3-2]|uniref:hypothetical protein n=1 Tax=Conexibacter sp. W3-3-2 TaxID=2675227 RepID=UPI0012B77231|nr:hypothetical protein [Conexibacter sp. W3-3-2]MTD47497.1 hypothetical protein [Conexibacter sp. W3-3-2]
MDERLHHLQPRPLPRRTWWPTLLRVAVFAAVVAAGVVCDHGAVVAFAPALLLLAFLLCGRFPGEELLDRLRSATARRPARRRTRLTQRFPRRAPVHWAVRSLACSSLAMRPPPRPA